MKPISSLLITVVASFLFAQITGIAPAFTNSNKLTIINSEFTRHIVKVALTHLLIALPQTTQVLDNSYNIRHLTPPDI